MPSPVFYFQRTALRLACSSNEVTFSLRISHYLFSNLDSMKTSHAIDYSEAKRIVDFIVEKAADMQKAIAVAVTDSHGELIAFARMDGVALPSINIAMNKAWTAARTGKPTAEIGAKVKHPERGHDISYYGDPRFVGWGGGVPVFRNGEVVGAVAVSGLSSSEDASLASMGANLISPA
jgi:glc operon protein GlcG